MTAPVTPTDAPHVQLLDGLRRIEAGLRAASPREAGPAMDAAPYLPSRTEVAAAFAAASPDALFDMAVDLAGVAGLDVLARVTVVMCERTRVVHAERERAARLHVLPPGGERLAAGQ